MKSLPCHLQFLKVNGATLKYKPLDIDPCTKKTEVAKINGKNEKKNDIPDIDRNMTIPREQVKFNKDKFCLRCFGLFREK